MEYTTLPERSEQPCGCILIRSIAGKMSLQYCPKHKAAPDLYEALQGLVDYLSFQGVPEDCEDKFAEAEKALAKTEGGK